MILSHNTLVVLELAVLVLIRYDAILIILDFRKFQWLGCEQIVETGLQLLQVFLTTLLFVIKMINQHTSATWAAE